MAPLLATRGAASSTGFGRIFSPTLGSFESISTALLTSTQSSVTISNIPGTYTHLQVRSRFVGTQNNPPGSVFVEVNSDTNTNNYHVQYLVGDGSTTSGGYLSPGGSRRWVFAGHTNGGVQQTYPHIGIVDILEYTNGNKYKTARAWFGNDNNSAGEICLDSGLWVNGAAITSLKFTPDAGSLAAGTHIALYGIKVAA